MSLFLRNHETLLGAQGEMVLEDDPKPGSSSHWGLRTGVQGGRGAGESLSGSWGLLSSPGATAAIPIPTPITAEEMVLITGEG